MALLFSKSDPEFNYQKHVIDYIRAFYPEEWKQLRNDEFLLKERKPEYIEKMKKSVNSYNENEAFTIRTSITLGEYDFQSGTFPLEDGLEENSFFYVHFQSSSFNRPQSYPKTFKLFFNNPETVKLALNKDEARNFVQNRKNRYGIVDREVSVKLKAVVTGQREGGSINEFTADIVSHEFEL
jgi:hypothetical protein